MYPVKPLYGNLPKIFAQAGYPENGDWCLTAIADNATPALRFVCMGHIKPELFTSDSKPYGFTLIHVILTPLSIVFPAEHGKVDFFIGRCDNCKKIYWAVSESAWYLRPPLGRAMGLAQAGGKA